MNIIEYMNNVIRKIKNIIIGWYRYLFKPKSKLAINRLKICSRCSHKEKILGEYFCNKCWCCIRAKVEVEEEHCDDNRW